jgi:hypothetical protein
MFIRDIRKKMKTQKYLNKKISILCSFRKLIATNVRFILNVCFKQKKLPDL